MILLRVEPGLPAAASLTDVKVLAWRHPGDEPLTILVGDRSIELGPEWRYDGSRELVAALEEFGQVEVVE